MKIDDEVVYTIKINNVEIDTVTMKRLADVGVPISKQQVSGNSIIVGRLLTKYKGPLLEEAFQKAVKEASRSDHVEFGMKPWSYLPGYPMGEMESNDEEE